MLPGLRAGKTGNAIMGPKNASSQRVTQAVPIASRFTTNPKSTGSKNIFTKTSVHEIEANSKINTYFILRK